MTRPTHAGRIVALAIAASLALVAPAAANTQQWSEPDETVTTGGEELDLQSVTISQNASEALFEAEIQYPSPATNAPNDQVQIFLDTNGDGNADRAVGFVGLTSGDYTVEVREVSTTPANCQRLGNAVYTSAAVPMPAPDPQGRRLLQAPFAASHLGASSYKWAAYVLNDSLFTRPTWDYLPNEANPTPSKPNPFNYDYDGCDVNGDGTPDASTISDRAFPVDMTKGHQYGTPPSAGSGSNPPPPTDPGLPERPGTRITYGLPLIEFKPIERDKMPQLEPKNSKSTDFISVTEAEKQLRGLNVPVTVRLLGRRSSEAASTRQAKWLRANGKGDEVMIQNIAAGKSLAVPAGAKPKTVKLYYYDRADDIADRSRKCELTSTAKARAALRGKTQAEAAFELRRLDCVASWTEAPAFGILQPETTTARKLGNGSIEVTIGMPRNEQDLLLIVREDPARAKTNELSFTENWRLVKSGAKNPSRVTVQVVERSTGRFVEGALVQIGDGDDYVADDLSNANGEAELVVPFSDTGRRTLFAVYNGNNGVTASGWRHLFVADLKGKPFTTAAGRRMKASKGVYKADVASSSAARRYRYSPATAGAGATGTEIAAPSIVQMQSVTLFRSNRSPSGVLPVVAPHNALDIPRNGSVLVCSAPGSIISVSGDANPIGGPPSAACARTVLATWKAALADIGNVRGELVAPHGATVKADAEAAERQGVQVGTPDAGQIGLTSIAAGHAARKKGVVNPSILAGLIDAGRGQKVDLPGNLASNGKIISDNGGGIISEAGGSIISDNGGGFVSTNGGTWISNNSGNFVSSNNANFQQNSIGLVPPATFGPMIINGGGIIGQDVGS